MIDTNPNYITFTFGALSDPYELEPGAWYLQERQTGRGGATIWGPGSFEMVTALRAERCAHYAELIAHATRWRPLGSLTEAPS